MANIVKIIGGSIFTDTLAIAEGSGNTHKAVIQLVRKYQDDLEEFGQLTFQMGVNSSTGAGQKTEYANLNEHQSTLLLTYMKNTKVIRAFKKNLVKAFFAAVNQLTKQPAVDPMKALSDPAAMRGLLLTYTEKVLALEEDKKILTPKAEALDRIANADGLTCITDTAKSLQIRPKDLFSWLSGNGWIYRRAGGKGWLAYQNRIQQGVLSHKVTTVVTSDGREKIIESVKVTPKGLAKLAGVFPEASA